jgi:hypothetical protein
MTACEPITLLDAARLWYDAGYCVVPSHENGSKRPFGPWKEYQSTRPTWEQIDGWLRSGKYTGIGVITGQVSGNVEMIELEGPSTQSGQALNKITKVADTYADGDIDALWRKVLAGCIERSAGGGLHIFVRVDGAPVPGNTKLANDANNKVLAETRGEGGFVIVAPTPGRAGHDLNTIYMFLEESSPTNTATISADELEALHYIITEAIDSHTGASTPPTDTTTPPAKTTPQNDSQGLTPWDDYANRTTWAHILEPMGWTYAYTAPDGRQHWTRPGKTVHEGSSATTIEDGPMYVFSTSTIFPAGVGMSKQHVYALAHHGGDHTAAARSLAGEGYGDKAGAIESLPPWVPDGINIADLTPQQLDDERAAWVKDKFPVIDWPELWADDSKEEWIAEPLLPARRLVALYSAPKVGKSLLMLEIAAAIASGKPIFSNQDFAYRQARVLYVDFENDPAGDVRERLKAMGYRPEELGELFYLSFPNMAGFDSAKGAEELMAAVDVYGCEVVVIDTVSRSVDGDENENDTWLAFYRHTGLKMKQKKIAMIRLDHSGKDETKGQRGGSAKSGDVDAVWRLSKIGENTITLTCEARRFQLDRESLTMDREEDPLRHVITKDPAGDRISRVLSELRSYDFPRNRDWKITDVRQHAEEIGAKTVANKKGHGCTTDIWKMYLAEEWQTRLDQAAQDA